jgi:hypothetical protein
MLFSPPESTKFSSFFFSNPAFSRIFAKLVLSNVNADRCPASNSA